MTREEAIEALRGGIGCFPVTDRAVQALDMAISALENSRPTGHWIDHQEGRWIYAKCSECGTVHDTQTNYCPNCGAKMESEDSDDK